MITPEMAARRADPSITPKRALVVGCANTVWAEVKSAYEFGDYHAIYCVKLAGVHWPGPFEQWITLHPEWIDDYEAQRARAGHPKGYEIVAPLKGEVGSHGEKGKNITRRITYRYPGMSSSASSGGYAVKIALEDGYERVVLAGVPMVKDDGHFTRSKPWEQVGSFKIGFEKQMPYMKGKVKSFSGWTKEILGAPTKEWLEGGE